MISPMHDRRKNARVAVLVAFLIVYAQPLCAGEREWRQYTQEGQDRYKRGDFQAAAGAFERAVREAQSFGEGNVRLATAFNNLALALAAQGRHVEAEPHFLRALRILEKALGPTHANVAAILNNLAQLYQDEGRYAEAEAFQKRDLAISEKALGRDHPDVATSLNNLGNLYRKQGRYTEAEPYLHRALAIYEKTFGPNHESVSTALNSLAELYRAQGRYAEAESLLRRALMIGEETLGEHHPRVAGTLNNLAIIYREQGHYAEVEPLLRRVIAIYDKALGQEHSDIATALNNLAGLYEEQGRYAEADVLYRRALTIDEKALGVEHPSVATTLSNLAGMYEKQGRHADAEAFLRRALVLGEKTLGAEHPSVATRLSNLASLYDTQGRYTEAEPLLLRALSIDEKALGAEHPRTATTLSNLGGLYSALSRYAEAEPLYRRALAIGEKRLGPEHPSVAIWLNGLANIYVAQGRYADAEPLYKRSIAIWEKALGPEHPNVALSFNNLATFYSVQGRNQDALNFVRRATRIRKARVATESGQSSINNLSEQRTYTMTYVDHVNLLGRALAADPMERAPLSSESFDVSQLARASDTAGAIARMAARFASGSDELANLTRSRQDSLARWQFVDAELIKAVSKPPAERNATRERSLHEELATLDKSLVELDATLDKRFPDYKTLTSPEPLKLVDAQALLGADEALVTYLVGKEESYLWVLRRDQAQFLRIEIGKVELDKTVQQLRRQLDPSEGVLRTFSLAQAHELYRRIFLPAEALLKGATHVMVVADGPLQSLPFGVLVTEPPKGEQPPDYRNAAWLAKRYALTVLPSESSLRALRRFAKSTTGNQPFTGFGDPVLEGDSQTRGANVTALFSRGAVADVRAVKKLQRLPETADELHAMAKSLGADKQTVHLQLAATETNVKKADLTRYRVLAFATHGLMAGDFKGLAEPALVLTPPEIGSELDDGLLIASKVAQLKLNADWVILSACNTAAADGTPGAEGLSGLAKAFFYAGSRALLVSHWPVASASTVKLTTRMFKEGADNPGIGKAEALRRSMLALMADDKAPEYAHPALWAPFVVVGEGGAR